MSGYVMDSSTVSSATAQRRVRTLDSRERVDSAAKRRARSSIASMPKAKSSSSSDMYVEMRQIADLRFEQRSAKEEAELKAARAEVDAAASKGEVPPSDSVMRVAFAARRDESKRENQSFVRRTGFKAHLRALPVAELAAAISLDGGIAPDNLADLLRRQQLVVDECTYDHDSVLMAESGRYTDAVTGQAHDWPACAHGSNCQFVVEGAFPGRNRRSPGVARLPLVQYMTPQELQRFLQTGALPQKRPCILCMRYHFECVTSSLRKLPTPPRSLENRVIQPVINVVGGPKGYARYAVSTPDTCGYYGQVGPIVRYDMAMMRVERDTGVVEDRLRVDQSLMRAPEACSVPATLRHGVAVEEHIQELARYFPQRSRKKLSGAAIVKMAAAARVFVRMSPEELASYTAACDPCRTLLRTTDIEVAMPEIELGYKRLGAEHRRHLATVVRRVAYQDDTKPWTRVYLLRMGDELLERATPMYTAMGIQTVGVDIERLPWYDHCKRHPSTVRIFKAFPRPSVTRSYTQIVKTFVCENPQHAETRHMGMCCGTTLMAAYPMPGSVARKSDAAARDRMATILCKMSPLEVVRCVLNNCDRFFHYAMREFIVFAAAARPAVRDSFEDVWAITQCTRIVSDVCNAMRACVYDALAQPGVATLADALSAAKGSIDDVYDSVQRKSWRDVFYVRQPAPVMHTALTSFRDVGLPCDTDIVRLRRLVERFDPSDALDVLPALLPALRDCFGLDEQGMETLRKVAAGSALERKHMPTLVKASPRAAVLFRALVELWADHRRVLVYDLPDSYRRNQMEAILDTNGGVSPELVSFRYCSVCKHVQTLLRDVPDGDGHSGYQSGLSNALLHYTGHITCNLKRSSFDGRHCETTPLASVGLLGRVVVVDGHRHMLCPQRGCGVPMLYREDACDFNSRGVACTKCTASMRFETQMRADPVVRMMIARHRLNAVVCCDSCGRELQGFNNVIEALARGEFSQTAGRRVFAYPANVLLCRMCHAETVLDSVTAQYGEGSARSHHLLRECVLVVRKRRKMIWQQRQCRAAVGIQKASRRDTRR